MVLTADDSPWARTGQALGGVYHCRTPAQRSWVVFCWARRQGCRRTPARHFRRAGVYHILAVSGFNVALLASSVLFVLSTLGMPSRVTAVVAGVTFVGFALVVGGQASVLRATVMGLLLLGALLLDRESQLMNALALAVLLLFA